MTNILNNQTLSISNQTWTAQNASKNYSLADNNGVLSFLTKPGPPPDNDPAFDGPTHLRSEIYGPANVKPNKPYSISFDFSVQTSNDLPYPGEWLVCFQLHGDNAVAGASPVLGFYVGEQLSFEACCQPIGQTELVYQTLGNVPFLLGQIYSASVTFVDARGAATGEAIVVLDGVKVLNVSNIVTGFASAVENSYPKIGIYAGVADGHTLPNVNVTTVISNVVISL